MNPEAVPRVPTSLLWLAGTEKGREWLQRLPRLIQGCASSWHLRLGEPFPGSYVSYVTPAVLPGGKEAVLKIQFTHRESEHEGPALAFWKGEAAVRLLNMDAERHALLLEMCSPGTTLEDEDPEIALDVVSELLARLMRPAGSPFRPLSEEAAWWAGYLPELWQRHARPFERRLLEAALELLTALPATQGEQVLLHQDLHPGNVLRARREPWLVIDPKPLTGEREFAPAPMVRAHELGHSREAVLHRLDRITDQLGLDRERARGWALSQTLAWAIEADRVIPHHVETAHWLLPPEPISAGGAGSGRH